MATFPLKDIPGTFDVVVEVYQEGDARLAARGHAAFTLAELRAHLGGDEGGWRSPITGHRYRVSLAPYLHTDTPTTRYVISSRFRPDHPLSGAHGAQLEAYIAMAPEEIARLGDEAAG